MLQTMEELFRAQPLCVLCTSAADIPHCSLMAYVSDEAARHAYMFSAPDSRKSRNMLANPNVSMLVDNRASMCADEKQQAQALTVGGVYAPFPDAEHMGAERERIIAENPWIGEVAKQVEGELIRIRVTSFLLLDGFSRPHFVSF